MENPPTLSDPGQIDKPISKMSGDEVTIRKNVDEIASNYQSFLGWNLYPPFQSPVVAHISNRLRRAELAAKDNLERAESYLHTATKLLEDLSTVKLYDGDLFKDFVEKLTNIEFDRYYGIREEIAMARSLIIKGIDFEHPDPPDFVFEYLDTTLKIECTSSHIVSADNLIQKICDSIVNKDSKYYSDKNAVLMMNITNILHNIVGNNKHPDFPGLKSHVKSDAEIFDWAIGSIIFIFYFTDPKEGKYKRNYLRCDTPNISNKLEEFLEEYYPEGDESTKEFYIGGET